MVVNAAQKGSKAPIKAEVTPVQVQGMMMTVQTPLWSQSERKLHVGRAFLDSAAQRNFISKAFATRAGLKAIVANGSTLSASETRPPISWPTTTW
jgi:hypothetical protein